MTLQAAFIFLSPDAEYPPVHTIVKTHSVELTVVPTRNYSEACEVANQLTNEGVVSIELCGGFGHRGVAKVSEALGNKVSVGVVRFDNHPGLEDASGDSVFTS